jgi:hypothetical protein
MGYNDAIIEAMIGIVRFSWSWPNIISSAIQTALTVTKMEQLQRVSSSS